MDGSERHFTTIDASERFAAAAREAEEKGQHGRAAALFRAALLLLKGEPFEEMDNAVQNPLPGEVNSMRAILSRSRQAASRLFVTSPLKERKKSVR